METWITKCSNVEYISIQLFYDSKCGCITEDDEFGFMCYVSGHGRNSAFCETSCFRPNCSCSDLYYHTAEGGCSPFKTNYLEKNSNSKVNIPAKQTSLMETDSLNQINSTRSNIFAVFTDCTPQELQKLKGGKSKAGNVCEEPYHIQCTFGCAKCFSVYNLCVYELDNNGGLIHCPSGSHLKNCRYVV